MQPSRIRVTLDDANRELGVGATMDEVLMLAMRRIGRWWETGRCDVGHEHLVTEAARTWLGKIVFAALASFRQGEERSGSSIRSTPGLLFALPVAVFEFSVGVHLTVKGFRAPALAALDAPSMPVVAA